MFAFLLRHNLNKSSSDLARMRTLPPSDRRRSLALWAGIAWTTAAAAVVGDATAVTVERHLALMGTEVRIAVMAADRAAALTASERVVRELEAANDRLSTWSDDSELASFNRAPAGEPVPLSARLGGELERALACAEATGGAFDPTVAALVGAWGLRQGGRRPTTEELERARAATGRHLVARTGEGAVRLHRRVGLEEGGWGKGAALDAALAAVDGMPTVESVRLDLGGQVAALGTGPWQVALADPRDRGHAVLAVWIDGGSLAVSGNSERGVTVDGERLGHLLDPRTGRPAPDFGTLAVWAPDGLTADCLATGLYVLGPERALALAEERPGVEVVALEVDRGRLRVRASSGWAGRIEPLVPELELEIGAKAVSRESGGVESLETAPGDGRFAEEKRDAGGRRPSQGTPRRESQPNR